MAKKFLSELIDSCYREDIHAMVLRDRNHPSIISWSIGNEVIERKEIRVIHTAKLLKNAILECDATRPVTEALCAWDRDWEIYDPHFEVLDIGGQRLSRGCNSVQCNCYGRCNSNGCRKCRPQRHRAIHLAPRYHLERSRHHRCPQRQQGRNGEG